MAIDICGLSLLSFKLHHCPIVVRMRLIISGDYLLGARGDSPATSRGRAFFEFVLSLFALRADRGRAARDAYMRRISHGKMHQSQFVITLTWL